MNANSPDTHESRFIDAARPLMIFGLVWHHLFEIPGSSHSPRLSMEGYSHFVPELLNTYLHMAMMTAVPVLSVISGFLFFRREHLDYTHLFSSRFRTVALAAWLWSALWFALGWLMFLQARSAGVLGDPGYGWLNYGFEDVGAKTVINGVFAASREPFAYQFWFVRDLIVTLLFAPFIHYFVRLFGWQLLVLMGIGWILIPDPPLLFSGNVPFFFAIGTWLAISQGPSLGVVLSVLEANRWWLMLLLLVALTLRIFSHEFGRVELFLQGHAYLCLLRVFGVLAIAGVISRLVSSQRATDSFFANYGCYTFFVFAMHYPLIELLQLVVLAIPGHATAVGMLLSWVLVPTLTIVISLAAAVAMEHYLPGIFNLLNGGRGRRAARAKAMPRRALRGFRDLPDPAPDTR